MKKNYYQTKKNKNSNTAFYMKMFFLFFLISLNGFSQGTSCATATPITINGACLSGLITDTTQDAPNIGVCPGAFNREGWYTFTVSGGPLNIAIAGTATNRNLFLQLISSTSSCTGLAQINCANNTNLNTGQTETMISVLNNGIYYIKVVNVGSSGNLNLSSLCVTILPSNYQCSTATALPCGTSNLAGTTVGTANITQTTACTISNYGVWYTFVGDGSTSTVSVTTTSYDVEMAISSGSCASLTNITCQDSALSSGTETYSFATTVGVNYYVYVASYASGSTTTGTFTISRTCTTPPSNYQCSSATSLPCGTSNLAGTTVGTTNITQTTACSMSNYGVWYSFAGDGNNATISVTTTSYDVKMAISSGSCASLTNITCQDSSLSSGTETYTFATTIGVNYYIYVAYYASGSTTTGTFTISRTCSAPFNPCASIPNIIACGGTTNATIAAGLGAYTTSSCGFSTPGNEQLYTFTPTTTGSYYITQQSSFDYIDYQFKTASSGCNNSGWTCISAISGAGTSTSFSLIAGTQYYLLLDPEASTGGSVSFILNCPITNDNCSGSIALTVNPTITCDTHTNGTTIGASQSQVGCSGTADDDVWYSFIATNTSQIVTVTPYGITDVVFQLFSGNCGALSSLGCINNNTSTSETNTFTGLTVGSTYYVRVYSQGSGYGQGTFSICVTTNLPCVHGPGTGISSVSCPYITAGGLGLNGSNPPAINSCSASNCVDLEATYLQINQTSNYTVQSIAYAPPYQYGCLQNAVSVNVDDVWSPTITLPFNFCFFGNNYNKCLIGSNGNLTFDLTNNTAGGYNAWSFNTNIPSNTLSLSTIFGVYQDIDPSKGGEVGWELITLNSGCRALVASWNNIPMFSSTCNSLSYTGMIVLYEDTNIIDVYIKEKNVCASWNNGNAIVGIQNSTGTQAVVATNRNGLDPDWTVTNEAWRFTPSGTSLATVKWYQGAGTGGLVLGTTSTINVCPVSTTIYTAEVTYSLCSGGTLKKTAQTTVTVGNSLIWNGSVDSDWKKTANWTPGTAIPNGSDCVVIPITPNNPIIAGTNYNGLAGTLKVMNGASLTVNSSNSITVTDGVTVQTTGTFTMQNNASLVQINNAVNSGNIVYKRNANIRSLDYVYWSSPVANFNVSNIASPLVLGPIYRWNPTVANPNGGQGNWESATGNTMTAAKGYIARGPGSFSASVAATLNGSFIGVPNNGDYTFTISRGSDTNTAYHTGINGTEINNYSDNWNLVGNPYPSAIKGSQFLFNNNTKIEGNIKLWTHGTLPSQIASPFYNTFIYNYSPGDYLTYNFTGTSCCPAASADLFIGAAQGFFVQMKDGPASSDIVTFNNSLRSYTYDNSGFYRFSNTPASIVAPFDINTLERNRIWLDLIDSNNHSDRTLFGYIGGATMGPDSFFDSKTLDTGSMAIYSLISSNDKYLIQGRQLPFDDYDEVPIGIHIQTAGSYSIAIGAVDGLFNTQNIYLKDKLFDIIYDIKAAPYRFNSTSGNIDERFKIVYRNTALSNTHHSYSNTILVASNEALQINSTLEPMDSIIVYDIVGRAIGTYNNIDAYDYTISNLIKNKSTLFLQIKLKNGAQVNQKVIF